MGQELTLRFHDEAKARMRHNRRDPDVVSHEDHIDPNGRFEIWVDEEPMWILDELIGADIEAYAQKRGRRANYSTVEEYVDYAKTHHTGRRGRVPLSDTTWPVYEVIVGVGSVVSEKDEHGRSVVDESGQIVRPHYVPPEGAHKILFDYLIDFEKRNGDHLRVVGAYFHADEVGRDGLPGAPHLHLDYLPIARDCKRGPKSQVSKTGALRQLGHLPKGMSCTQDHVWHECEREHLWEITTKYIPDATWKRSQKGMYKQTRSTEEYKIDELQADIAGLRAALARLQEEYEMRVEQEKELEDLRQRADDMYQEYAVKKAYLLGVDGKDNSEEEQEDIINQILQEVRGARLDREAAAKRAKKPRAPRRIPTMVM